MFDLAASTALCLHFNIKGLWSGFCFGYYLEFVFSPIVGTTRCQAISSMRAPSQHVTLWCVGPGPGSASFFLVEAGGIFQGLTS